jgi:hypothetical protein
MRKETFAGVCNILQSLPSKIDWDDNVALSYAIVMNNWDDVLVGLIVRHVLLNCTWRPTIAEMRLIGIRIAVGNYSAADLALKISNIINAEFYTQERWDKLDKGIEAGVYPFYLKDIVESLGGFNRIGSRSSDQNVELIANALTACYASLEFDRRLEQPKLLPELAAAGRAVTAQLEGSI